MGPVGPSKPPRSPSKSKKKKKDKTKDKKHDGATEKQKDKKKKDKAKKAKHSVSSDSSNDAMEAQQQKRAKRYKGHFSHPSFGAQILEISMECHKKAATGVWAIMGQVLDSTVNILQEDNNLVFSDGKVVLDGMMAKRGVVRGEVVM